MRAMFQHQLLLLVATAFLLTLVSTDKATLQVIALRGREDDASRRFFRSAEVFGYDYHVIDLSEHGPTTDAVKDELKLVELKHMLDTIAEPLPSHVLVLDSHSSILIKSPSKLLEAAEALKADFVFIYQNETTWEDAEVQGIASLPRSSDIFKGMLAKTSLLTLAIPEVPSSLSPEYTAEFLSSIKKLDSSVPVVVDLESKLFQSVPRDSERLSIRYEDDIAYLQNEDTHSLPVVAVAAPDAKVRLFHLSSLSIACFVFGYFNPFGVCFHRH
ncbi:unnamed protein product [Dibothriocephalus latus]|uniref:PLOD1-3-like GT domain-containing protein n=1 Tax=Dibothriocephalus latus TaxID=60516 RepID=A0A3P7L0T6_DIBLA|nr:unnamed protein product [Dibothriocephalus latus]